MTKKVSCKIKTKKERVRVKVIRAPLVDNNDLRHVLLSRARAVVL